MNNKRIKSTHKPSYTSDVNDSIKSSDSDDEEYDEKALADVAVDSDDVAGEDVGEKRKRVAEAYLERIPFDIQEEIIKILPIKSLVRFRLVSKQWKSLIDSSKFIAEYHTHQKHKHHHLLVSYCTRAYSDREYVSIVDDDTFPQHKFSFNVRTSLKPLHQTEVVTSQGLLFVHGYYRCSETWNSLIWNPSIRKSVHITVRDSYHPTYFGFGVCPDTCDPKIVEITFIYNSHKQETIYEVFTLSTNVWRRLSKNLPREGITYANQVAIDRFIYWLAYERIYVDDGYYEDDGQSSYQRNLIVSFDMTSEEFTEINLPDSLEADPPMDLRIYNIRESLGVVQIKTEASKDIYSVWKMMEQGVSNSFTKLYIINTTDVITDVYGFRKSGEPISETERGLFAYDPDSKHISSIEILGARHFCSVNSYIETLLLLDH